jgi:hypothetical protein
MTPAPGCTGCGEVCAPAERTRPDAHPRPAGRHHSGHDERRRRGGVHVQSGDRSVQLQPNVHPSVAGKLRDRVRAIAVVHLPGDAGAVECRAVLDRFLRPALTRPQEHHVGEPRRCRPEHDAHEVRGFGSRDVELQRPVLHGGPTRHGDAAVDVQRRSPEVRFETETVGGDPGVRREGNGAGRAGATRRGETAEQEKDGAECHRRPSVGSRYRARYPLRTGPGP